MKFSTGPFYKTIGINNAINENKDYIKEIINCVEKYLSCNWGILCDEDINLNEQAIKYGDRILGAYNTTQGKIYIITECDRSYTTILFASEY